MKNMSITYLTPNRRLSATLLKKYHAAQLEQQKTNFQTLDVLPFNQWITRLWEDYSIKYMIADKHLLSPDKEQVIWEDILNRSSATHALLQLSETAEIAKSAWSTLKKWQVSFRHPDFSHAEDSFIFQKWAEEFESICLENKWLDSDSVIIEICDLIIKQNIDLPQKIILLGFTELTPIQKKLIECCEEVGTQCMITARLEGSPLGEQVGATSQAHKLAPPLQGYNNGTQRIRLKDEETEITCMARFAKAIHQKNPQATIGCIVPHLEKIRDPLLSIFSNVFSDKNNFSIHLDNLPFNISAGKKLSSYPIIHMALQLLNLSCQSIDYHTFSQLLRSPFLGEAESEMLNRLQIDRTLCKKNSSIINLNNIELLKESPQFAQRLINLFKHIEQTASLLSIHQWIDIFMERLRIIGWPGERSLNSHEYQIVQRFLELLTYYRGFNTILPATSFPQALHYLIYLTNHTIFQPESPETKIQILGLLEAAGLSFDYIWVSGLDNVTWPPPVKPNPFIPKQLQRKLSMPHASADRELEYSKLIIEQLIFNANYSIFSHAENNGDCELQESSLISHLPIISLDEIELSDYHTPAQLIYLNQKLETIVDDQAPKVTASNTQGGVSIIKQQALCPFKAFAQIRLYAKKIELPTLGLTPKDRGNIIHKALEFIWLELKDSHTLSAYSETALEALLEKHIWLAINTILKEPNQTRYLILESFYLKNLIYQWLQFEKTRPPFTVKALEYEKQTLIGDMTLSIRVDRIDELADGKELIIDYKTGKNNHIKYWFSDRPEEPQLPIYCLSNNNIMGIAFAETHLDSLNFKGISQHTNEINSIAAIHEVKYADNHSWENQILKWQAIILKLSQNFYNGEAAVFPKNGLETCRNCHLKTFCRVSEICA